MKILILGVGYVGQALLQELQKLPYEVWITATDASRISELEKLGNKVILIKPNDDEALNAAISACNAMVVLVAPKNSASYEQTYLQTAKRITSVLKNRNAPFYLLYTSSTSVCEAQVSEWVTENEKLSPVSLNAKILLETEEEYLNHSKSSTCILRLGGIYGPGRELLRRAARLSGQIMPGNGNEYTNHIHLNDIVAAILFCLKQRLIGLYHLVNDDHITRKELYTKLCEKANIPPPTWDNKTGPQARNYKIANEKIKKKGFRLSHPILNLTRCANF